MKKNLFVFFLAASLIVCPSILILAQTGDGGVSKDYQYKQCLQNCKDQYSGDATQPGEITYARCVQNCENIYNSNSNTNN